MRVGLYYTPEITKKSRAPCSRSSIKRFIVLYIPNPTDTECNLNLITLMKNRRSHAEFHKAVKRYSRTKERELGRDFTHCLKKTWPIPILRQAFPWLPIIVTASTGGGML